MAHSARTEVLPLFTALTCMPTADITECNSWLYNYIFADITPAARAHSKQPSSLNDADLWNTVRSTFQERPDVHGRRLIRQFCDLKGSRDKGNDRSMIGMALKLRTEILKLGYPAPDCWCHDIVHGKLASRWQEVYRL